ncbi:hypothetical protein Rrhod_2005 [Rhodococcus rhodnii LMG 5362]|uniref:Uncharacterized protein n=1 Tax=Rhodococcus rhodnii LMG 5362 TaxID=1273125 RepID=R7WMT3_9NOCA|nr:hypothetical protein Rrhod_2005 [Rhodococcus rhodnii LMG 5362]
MTLRAGHPGRGRNLEPELHEIMATPVLFGDSLAGPVTIRAAFL